MSKLSHSQALGACDAHGLQLLEVRSEAKLNAVKAVATVDYSWLGLTCRSAVTACDTDTGLWSWHSDGANLSCTYNGFSLSADSTIEGGAPSEYCAHWWTQYSMSEYWAPHACSHQGFYGTACECKQAADGCTPANPVAFASPSPPALLFGFCVTVETKGERQTAAMHHHQRVSTIGSSRTR